MVVRVKLFKRGIKALKEGEIVRIVNEE